MTNGGLREQKRLRTRHAIERAALELALDRGDAQPTVEAIAARAGVSQRTFFNYFPTRDDALLGAGLELAADADPAAGSDLLAMLEHAALQTLAAHDLDLELIRLRRRVLRASPELFARRIALGHRFEEQLEELAIARATADGRDEPAVVGRIVARVAMATLRAGWLEWVEQASGSDAESVVRDAFAQLRRIVRAELA